MSSLFVGPLPCSGNVLSDRAKNRFLLERQRQPVAPVRSSRVGSLSVYTKMQLSFSSGMPSSSMPWYSASSSAAPFRAATTPAAYCVPFLGTLQRGEALLRA